MNITTEDRVLKIILKEVSKFRKDVSFIEQGIDSVSFVKILANIEDDFGILFPDNYLYINKDSNLENLLSEVMNAGTSFDQLIQSIDNTVDE